MGVICDVAFIVRSSACFADCCLHFIQVIDVGPRRHVCCCVKMVRIHTVLLCSVGSLITLPFDVVLIKVKYCFHIHASHLCKVAHLSGQLDIVSLHMIEIIFEPVRNLFDIIDELTKMTRIPIPSVSQLTILITSS